VLKRCGQWGLWSGFLLFFPLFRQRRVGRPEGNRELAGWGDLPPPFFFSLCCWRCEKRYATQPSRLFLFLFSGVYLLASMLTRRSFFSSPFFFPSSPETAVPRRLNAPTPPFFLFFPGYFVHGYSGPKGVRDGSSSSFLFFFFPLFSPVAWPAQEYIAEIDERPVRFLFFPPRVPHCQKENSSDRVRESPLFFFLLFPFLVAAAGDRLVVFFPPFIRTGSSLRVSNSFTAFPLFPSLGAYARK